MSFALCLAPGGDPAAEPLARAALVGAGPATVTRAGSAVVAAAGGAGPWRLREGGPVLVGDLALANADDLRRTLGVEADDGALVLHAFDRWGEAAGARLRGHYALALWDPAGGRLWAARDLFGVKPLFHRRDGGRVLLADTIEGLLRAGIPPPDEAWVAEFLAGRRMSAERTPFVGVSRLPAGHALLGDAGALRVERQRDRFAELPVRGLSATEAPEALREALDAAVGRALARGPAGAMLSGGLDSGSLAALAAQRGMLRTYSLVFPGRPYDERPWIDAVLASGRLVSNLLTMPDDADQSGVRLATREHPADGYGHGRIDRLLAAAAADGLTGLLDGHGGDEVIGTGAGRLGELAAGRRLRALWGATRGVAPLAGQSRPMLALLALAAAAPDRATRVLAGRLAGRGREDRTAWRRTVRADLAARTGLVERARAAQAVPEGATAEEARSLAALDPVRFADSFESLARVARRHGVAQHYPFLDERAVGICLARPAAEKLRGGTARALLRDAVAGLLPDAVRLRATKTDFLPALAAEIAADRDGRLARTLEAPGRVAPFVDVDAFRALAARVRAPGAGVDELGQAWRVLSLADWLGRVEAFEGPP